MASDGEGRTEALTSRELIDRLTQLLSTLAGSDPLVVFDGDGTLWSGDVGNDVFEFATKRGLLHDSLRPRLLREAEEYDLALNVGAATSSLAAQFVQATHTGAYPEAPLCALQSWCYTGMTEDEVRALTRDALGDAFPSRHQREVRDVIDWARSRGLRCVVVSASPRLVVEAASTELGFEPDEIVGVETLVDEYGVVGDDLDGEVPYGERKVTRARERFGGAPWLAAFGDNGFDSHMLHTAAVGVAVRPKPALASVLHRLPNTVRLHPR